MLKKILFTLMLLPALSFADTPKGEKLVQQLWRDIQEKRIDTIKEYTSKEFQAINSSMEQGELESAVLVLNRYEELTLIENLNIQSYTLANIRATQGENIIVVTYSITIEMEGDIDNPISETVISVWKKLDDEWKWAAQAEVSNSIQPAPPPNPA